MASMASISIISVSQTPKCASVLAAGRHFARRAPDQLAPWVSIWRGSPSCNESGGTTAASSSARGHRETVARRIRGEIESDQRWKCQHIPQDRGGLNFDGVRIYGQSYERWLRPRFSTSYITPMAYHQLRESINRMGECGRDGGPGGGGNTTPDLDRHPGIPRSLVDHRLSWMNLRDTCWSRFAKGSPGVALLFVRAPSFPSPLKMTQNITCHTGIRPHSSVNGRRVFPGRFLRDSRSRFRGEQCESFRIPSPACTGQTDQFALPLVTGRSRSGAGGPVADQNISSPATAAAHSGAASPRSEGTLATTNRSSAARKPSSSADGCSRSPPLIWIVSAATRCWSRSPIGEAKPVSAPARSPRR